MSEREDDLKAYKAHVQAVNRATDKDIEKAVDAIARDPDFLAAKIIRKNAEIKRLTAVLAEARAAFRAGQESMKARAVEVAKTKGVYPELNVWNGGPEWYRHGQEIASAIAALEPVNE